ncbi:MAG: hypothetical protein FWF50_06360 [Defluviitaleaceae bacterium]|nr:hypothetical protein [Defluviitaleaceae bacterium]
MKRKSLLKDNKGIIAIEMLISFVGFVLFTAVIVTFINVASIQLRFHHALTQTALETSFYAQALEMVGVTYTLRRTHALGNPTRQQIDGNPRRPFSDGILENGFSMLDNISDGVGNAASGNANSAVYNLGMAYYNINMMGSTLQTWAENPRDTIQGLIWIALHEGSETLISLFMGNVVAPAFFMRHLNFHDGQTGIEYVSNIVVQEDTIDFVWWEEGFLSLGNLRESGTNMFAPAGANFLSGSNADTIGVHIRYNLDLGRFFFLPSNIRFETEVRQEVQTRAWVGDGRRFNGDVRGARNARAGGASIGEAPASR